MTALPDIPRLYTALAECLAVLLFTPALAPRFSRAVTGGITLLWAAVLSAFLGLTGDVPGGLGTAVLQIAHNAEQRPIHQRQQQQRQRLPWAAGGPEGAVQLPLHAGGKLCQNKRPGAVIPGFQQGDAPHTP